MALACKRAYGRDRFRYSRGSLRVAFGSLNVAGGSPDDAHMMPSPDAVLVFGPFRLVATKHELWKKEKRLKLRALPLAVLAYLVQHPGRVIPIEEIRTAIWG